MTKLQQIDITDSEWEVMRVIWTQQKTTSNEIITILKEKRDWRPTTVKTLIARLVKKGLVGTESQNNRYIYKPLVSESESWKRASYALFSQICAQKMGKKIAFLIENSLLSFDDIKLLQLTIDQKKLTAVNHVPCDCIPGQCNCDPGSCSVS